MLAGAREIEWTALKRAVTPKLVTSGETTEFNREGVTVWRRVAGAVAAGAAADRARVRAGSVSGGAAAQCGVLGRGPRGHPCSCTGLPVDDAGGGTRAATRAVPAAAGCGQRRR